MTSAVCAIHAVFDSRKKVKGHLMTTAVCAMVCALNVIFDSRMKVPVSEFIMNLGPLNDYLCPCVLFAAYNK